MARPSYGVVSAFAVIISLVGVATKFGAPLIPPQPENSLARSTGEFLQQGGQQRIDWRPLSPQLFGEAKRLDRPVMLVLGAIWSHDGRAIDRLIFTDPDIQLYLARNFLCARVDLDESPEWQTAFLPVHRANFHTRVGFQIWFLAPDGEVFDFVGSRSSGLEIDPNAFQKELIQVRSTLARMQDPEGGESVPGERQRADRNLLLNSDSQVPDLEGHLKMVASMSDRERGGFQNDGYRSVRASPWLTLVSTGHVDVARVSLDPVVRSSVVDWLDGGFFRLNNSYDWYVLQFDKLAVQNAEMMYLCALVGLLDKDPFYELIAKRTFDSLTGEFVHAGQIATCRVGDETSLKRSVRSSFAVRDFRRIWGTGTLNADESDWARQVLGLSVDKNEPMVIRVKRPELLLRDMATAETVLQKLRKRKEAAPKRFSTRPRADVNGRVIAKLLACARLWKDPERLRVASVLFENFESFRTGSDVLHMSGLGARSRPFLGDYLAYADAALNDYLASGRPNSLATGAAVLKRAKELFSSGIPNSWYTTTESIQELGVRGIPVPELLDDVGESAAAMQIRLLDTYGRLLADDSMRQEAWQTVLHYGEVCSLFGVFGSSYYTASLQASLRSHAFAVGPKAQQLADELQHRVPGRLVAPAFGSVQQSLQQRPPGIYLWSERGWKGPLELDEAAKALSEAG